MGPPLQGYYLKRRKSVKISGTISAAATATAVVVTAPAEEIKEYVSLFHSHILLYNL